jgi:hypothetical protein
MADSPKRDRVHAMIQQPHEAVGHAGDGRYGEI